MCSIEFNLLYRWHTTLSKGNVKWVEEEIAKLVPHSTDYTSQSDLTAAVKTFTSKTKGVPPSEWTFGGYVNLLACVIYVILKWNTDYPVQPMVGSKTMTWLKFFKKPQRTLLVLTRPVEFQQL